MILIGRGLDFREDPEIDWKQKQRSEKPESKAVQLSACETYRNVSMCPAKKQGKQEREEEEKDDGAYLPEIVHHFRW